MNNVSVLQEAGLGRNTQSIAEPKSDPPENCHLNVKKLQKNLPFKKNANVNFFWKKAIVWYSNGNFGGSVHNHWFEPIWQNDLVKLGEN